MKNFQKCFVSIIWLDGYKSRIDFRKLSTFEDGNDVQRSESCLKAKVAKEDFTDIPLHNIWEFYKVLVQFPFTTNKMELDIEYKKLFI